MKVKQLLESWDARQIALHLQQLLVDAGFNAELESCTYQPIRSVDIKSKGINVRFSPDYAAHVSMSEKKGIEILHGSVKQPYSFKMAWPGITMSSTEEAFKCINNYYEIYKEKES